MAKQTPTDEQIHQEVFDAFWKRRPPATVAEIREEIWKKYDRRLSNTYLYSVKDEIAKEYDYSKGSRVISAAEPREAAQALHAFDNFQRAIQARSEMPVRNADVIIKLEPVMPLAEKVDQILKRGKSERVKKAIQEFIKKRLEEIDSDLGGIIENFEKDAFGAEEETKE